MSRIDPFLSDEVARERPESFSKRYCIVLHTDTGTGRYIICHSQSPELADGIFAYLLENVKAYGKNCEFISRHLRNERERLTKFIKNAKKAVKDDKTDDEEVIKLG